MKLDLTNKRFGDLTAVKPIRKKHTHVVWQCQCDCGNLTECEATRLRRGKKKSCGCRKLGEKHYHWSGYKGISGYFWRGILGSAKTRNLVVSITPKQAWELFEKQNGKCAITKVKLTFCRDERGIRKGEQTASLDRIDSSKGYEISNIQWVHKVVNIMKNDMTLQELVSWCKKIINGL